MPVTESRIVDLELRFMKLERFTQELSEVVAEQRHLLDALTLETRRLRERLDADEGDGTSEEKPPHY
jgi:uncharacterized coiled-coil protein SlyX